MKVELDFQAGQIEGLFIIKAKKGIYYATKLYQYGKVLRAYTYYVEPLGKLAYETAGEYRIPVEEIESITITNRKY